MRVLVTGADGFLGRRIVDALLATGRIGTGGAPVSRLLLMDLQLRRRLDDPRVVPIAASFTDAAARERALAGGVDVLFHLASVPGGAAQADPALGRAVNLDASLALMDAMAAIADRGGRPPIVVYASSIAAIGPTQAAVVDDDTPLRPRGSYGCHKLMLEIHLADLTARGWIDARSLRPAGIVARPRHALAGFATAWMSELFHAAAQGEPFDAPVSAQSTARLQSVACVADSFLHAATLPAHGLPDHRAWTLPALNPRIDALVQAIERRAAPARPSRIRLDGGAGRVFPAQHLPLAEALGFRHDGSLDALVRRALAAVRSPA